MSRKWEWLLAALVTLLAAVWLTTPLLEPKPSDVELKVDVRELPPLDSKQQLVEVTVRWHWLRKPARPGGEESIGFVFDRGQWGPYNGGSFYGSQGLSALLARAGEPQPFVRKVVPSGEDGEMKLQLFAHGENAFYRSRVLPIRVQLLHARHGPFTPPDGGWVKAVGGDHPL